MSPEPGPYDLRFEKRRTQAVVTLVSGESVQGCFFIAGGSAAHYGAERVADLLNSEPGFFPFEIDGEGGPHTVLYNRVHVISAQIFDDEARRDAGYTVARRRDVSVLLSNGRRISGAIRIYQPEERSRLSDWARQPEIFRYIEGDSDTLIVNVAHIVAVTEVRAT